MSVLLDTIFSPNNTSELNTLIWSMIAIIWIYCTLRAARDIYSRSDSSLFQLFCIFLVIVGSPIIGLPLYLLIRPLTRKDDSLGRQMLIDMESVPCSSCMRPNLTGYDHCVFCGSALKISCKNCKEMYPHTHQYCYKCGAPNLTWKE